MDLDCLDTGIGMANEYAAPGGLRADDLRGCLEVVGRRRGVVSLRLRVLIRGLRVGRGLLRWRLVLLWIL